jgi:spindle assembly abnormal protein 6
MTDLNRDSPMFDHALPMELVRGGDILRHSSLTFRFIPGTRIPGPNQPERLYRFEITEETDPYFLYFLEVGESEYHLLKSDQKLMVEFAAFPDFFLDLLHKCCHNSSVSGEDNGGAVVGMVASEIYTARLDMQAGQFQISMTNKYKQTQIFGIRLTVGSDSAVKAYLASRLYCATNESTRLRQEVHLLQGKVQGAEQERYSLEQELQRVRNLIDVDLQSLRSQHAAELAALRNSKMDELEETKTRYDAQVAELRHQLEGIRMSSRQKIEGLDSSVEGKLARYMLSLANNLVS